MQCMQNILKRVSRAEVLTSIFFTTNHRTDRLLTVSSKKNLVFEFIKYEHVFFTGPQVIFSSLIEVREGKYENEILFENMGINMQF